MISSTRNVPPVVFDKLCVVYDAHTGDVIHLHRVTTLEGGDTPSDKAIQERALKHANLHAPALAHAKSKQIPIPPNVKVVLVDPKHYRPGAAHKIDLKSLQLVALPIAEDRLGLDIESRIEDTKST